MTASTTYQILPFHCCPYFLCGPLLWYHLELDGMGIIAQANPDNIFLADVLLPADLKQNCITSINGLKCNQFMIFIQNLTPEDIYNLVGTIDRAQLAINKCMYQPKIFKQLKSFILFSIATKAFLMEDCPGQVWELVGPFCCWMFGSCYCVG